MSEEVIQPIDCGSGLGAYLAVGSSATSILVPKPTGTTTSLGSQHVCFVNLGSFVCFIAMGSPLVQKIATVNYKAILPGCEVLIRVPSLPPDNDLIVSAICKAGQTTELQICRCFGN